MTVSVHQAKTQLSRLLDLLEQGEDVVIVRHGRASDRSRASFSNARRGMRSGPRVLSVVCYWEVVITAQKGLLRISDPVNWWNRATNLLGGTILSVRAAHISAL
jgi:PIN domain nuclease of toxin-antitoxin system